MLFQYVAQGLQLERIVIILRKACQSTFSNSSVKYKLNKVVNVFVTMQN